MTMQFKSPVSAKNSAYCENKTRGAFVGKFSPNEMFKQDWFTRDLTSESPEQMNRGPVFETIASALRTCGFTNMNKRHVSLKRTSLN